MYTFKTGLSKKAMIDLLDMRYSPVDNSYYFAQAHHSFAFVCSCCYRRVSVTAGASYLKSRSIPTSTWCKACAEKMAIEAIADIKEMYRAYVKESAELYEIKKALSSLARFAEIQLGGGGGVR